MRPAAVNDYMELNELSGLAADYAPYRTLRDQLKSAKVIQLEGLAVSAKGFFLAQLRRDTGRPVVVISYNNDHATRLADDLHAFGIGESDLSLLLSSSETLLYTEGAPDYALIGKRQRALRRIALGDAPVVVSSGLRSRFCNRTIGARADRGAGSSRRKPSGETLDLKRWNVI